jgi:hypothetical protein
LGKADFRAKLHGICCDTLEFQMDSQNSFSKEFSGYYGKLSHKIDTTQVIFNITKFQYFQYDSLNSFNNKKGFHPFVPSGAGRRRTKVY